MKINDLERALGVKRSSIFYYEREGLLSPRREDNNYREYTEDDLRRLKTVIVLRKLGFTVGEIRDLLCGERELADAAEQNIARLEDRSAELGEAISLCREIQRQALTMDRFDPDEWFETVENREQQGRRFMDLIDDAAEGVTTTLAFVQQGIGFQGPVYAQLFFSEEGIGKRRLWKLYWGMLAAGYLLLLAVTYLLPGQYTRLVSPVAALVFTVVEGVVGSLVLWACARYIIPGRDPRQALWITFLLIVGVNSLLGVVGRQAMRTEVDETARADWLSDQGVEAGYVGDDPEGYVQTAYNDRYYGGKGELEVWQTDERLFVFASWGNVYGFRKNETGSWTQFFIDTPTTGGILYTADEYGPRRYPSLLMLSDGTAAEPVYEAHFSTGYIPLFSFDVSGGQEYTGILFGMDGSGRYRYEIDRAVYSGTSDWPEGLGYNENKPDTTWANLYGSVIGRAFLDTYRDWRDDIWRSEPFYTGDQDLLGAEASYILWARYYAPSALTVRPNGTFPCVWGANSFSEQLYWLEQGPTFQWREACQADISALLQADEITPALLQSAAASIEEGHEALPFPIDANGFLSMTYFSYYAARSWRVTVPDELIDLGSRTFRAVNGAK